MSRICRHISEAVQLRAVTPYRSDTLDSLQPVEGIAAVTEQDPYAATVRLNGIASRVRPLNAIVQTRG